MEDLLKVLAGALGTLGVGGAALGWLYAHPEKAEKWVALTYRWGSTLFRFAHRQYVKHDLQGRVNEFTGSLGREAPFLAAKRLRVELTDGQVDRAAFINQDAVFLRLRRSDPADMNFVHGAYMFVATSLLATTKRHLSQSQREALDVFVTTRLLDQEKESVKVFFVDEYLAPMLNAPKSKMAEFVDKFGRIDRRGMFFPILLQELDYLGKRVYAKPQSSRIIEEVSALIDFLDNVACRNIGEESDLEFVREYCRVGIVIIGRRQRITMGGEVYVEFIRQNLLPKKIETIYLVGVVENRDVLDNVAASLDDAYEAIRRREANIVLTYANPENQAEVARRQYLLVLRRRGASVLLTSDERPVRALPPRAVRRRLPSTRKPRST